MLRRGKSTEHNGDTIINSNNNIIIINNNNNLHR